MSDLVLVGADWLIDQVEGLTDHIDHMSPTDFNEQHRYLPESVTPMPGYIRFSVNPFMREPINCFDPDNPIREVNFKKGHQITYTTLLECGMLYVIGFLKTLPLMYMTADKELAKERVEVNIIPMINHSGFGESIRSSDEDNTRKTGKTANHIQWEGGGYFVPFGAKNADKMRAYSICYMMKDEIDAWPLTVGKDGDPDALSDGRCSAYWERRKIFRGSTPLLKGTSKIEKAFLNGDQRRYRVLCLGCGFPQALRWSGTNKKTKKPYGFLWDYEKKQLVAESVRYVCSECGHAHYEHDKERLFSESEGAHWHPTATPIDPFIRSYHLPGFYSPAGMQPWSQCVTMFLAGWDPETKRVKDIGKFQVFYNNILAEPFEILGSKVTFATVSAHRRAVYRLGEIPNEYAIQYSGSGILFLTCLVDVHKSNLAVAVMGWTRDARCYLIEYMRLEDDDPEEGCGRRESPVWGLLREIIEEKSWTADDGKVYPVAITLIDAGYENELVTDFCSEYEIGVYPILGRERSAKNQKIQEFAEFTTQSGTVGYRILVDHYKDRLAPVLRREWVEDSGTQPPYHFNAAIDTTDKQLKELTKEYRKEKTDERGNVSHYWHRSGNAKNELWDLLVYGSAAVEILAWGICVQQFELETVDWATFWNYLETEQLFFTAE